MKLTKNKLKRLIKEAVDDFLIEQEESLGWQQRTRRLKQRSDRFQTPGHAERYKLDPPRDLPTDPQLGRARRPSDDPREKEVTDYLAYEMNPKDTLETGSQKSQMDLFDSRFKAKEHMDEEELGGREKVEKWHEALLDAGLDPAVSIHDALDIRPIVMRSAPKGASLEDIAKVMSNAIKALMPMRGSKPWDEGESD